MYSHLCFCWVTLEQFCCSTVGFRVNDLSQNYLFHWRNLFFVNLRQLLLFSFQVFLFLWLQLSILWKNWELDVTLLWRLLKILQCWRFVLFQCNSFAADMFKLQLVLWLGGWNQPIHQKKTSTKTKKTQRRPVHHIYCECASVFSLQF